MSSGLTPVTTAGGRIRAAMEGCLERHGDRTALGGSDPVSYAQLGERIRAAVPILAAALAPGGRGRHVGFSLGNRNEYVVLYFAALFAGHRPLLLDSNFNRGEIEAIRHDCGLDLLILEGARLGALDLPERGEAVAFGDDVALLPLGGPAPAFAARAETEVCRFTSGTTGRPKCLEFSGHAVVSAAENWVLGTGLNGGDRTLALAALSNGLAFNTSLLSSFLAGAELHFLKGLPLTRPVAKHIERFGITRLVAFPTLYRNFVASGGPEASTMASLRHAISAGAPLWPDVRDEFRHRFQLDISDYYGIAETGPVTFEREAGHHSGLGLPLPGAELRTLAGPDDEPGVGEVLVRTASMASGYLNHPGLFEARIDGEGFYHSGDRGRLDDGRLHLVGRTQDHINVAGRKIDPTEIVSLVLTLDGVEDAIAFPDEDMNREALVHLVVVTPDGGVTKSALSEVCRERLAPYKVPGRISFVPEIPRTGIGKPRIAVLREQLNPRAAS